jgi:hypothetical protein
MMFSLNKWNQWKIYMEILTVDFHVMSQILNYSLKLLEILFKDSGFIYGTF